MLRPPVRSQPRWRSWQRAAIGCLLLLLGSSSLLLASPTEEEAYSALEQIVTSGAQAQTIRAAQTFLRRFPQSAKRPQVLFWLAEAFYATQVYRDAVTGYQRLLRETPKSPYTAIALHRLGLSYLYRRSFEAALLPLTQLLEQFPGYKEADQILFLMATSHFEQGRFYDLLLLQHYEEAIPLLTTALGVVSDAAQECWLRWLLARAYAGAGDIPQALRTLAEYGQHFPRSPHTALVQQWQGDLLLRQRDISAALVAYRAALQLASDSTQAEQVLLTVAELLQEQRAFADAVDAWQEVLTGILLEEARQFAEAAQVLAKAVEQLPDAHMCGQALYHLGKAYMALRQQENARAVFNQLLRDGLPASATDPERLNLDLMLQELTDYDRALQAYQQVASRFPQQQRWALTALFRAGELYEAQQQYQKALGMYQRIMTADPNDKGRFAAERIKLLKEKLTKPLAPQG